MQTVRNRLESKLSAEGLLERLKENWFRAADPVRDISVLRQRLHGLLNAAGFAVLAPYGLTLAQMETLFTLRAAPPPHRLTPLELTRSILITGGGLTKVLRELERRGLVKCIANKADARSKHVELTRAGKAVAEEVLPKLLETEGRLLRSTLSAGEVGLLARLLRKAVAGLESK